MAAVMENADPTLVSLECFDNFFGRSGKKADQAAFAFAFGRVEYLAQGVAFYS